MLEHLLSAEAENELDDIWCYIARGSGSLEAADLLIHSPIGFFCSQGIPILAAAATNCRLGCAVFPSAITSFSTA
jgi:hypothetical protein